MNLHAHIEQLGRENYVIHRFLQLHRCRECTYEEALQQIVASLAAINDQQQKTLVEVAMRGPVSILTGPSS